MAKNPQFSLDSIGGGAEARSAELAIIGTRIVAIQVTAKTRMTKLSIKTITIR
jgi:hypothetical protein